MLVAVQVLQEGEEAPKGCGVYVVNDAMTVCLDLEGIVDPQKEAEKLQAKQVPAHILYGALSQPLAMVESADLCVHMVNAYAGKHVPSRSVCRFDIKSPVAQLNAALRTHHATLDVLTVVHLV